MITPKEIEALAKEIFRRSFSSVKPLRVETIRILLKNGVFIDIFQSPHDKTKFAIHADTKDGKIFRLDCRPERKYQKLSTFPWHFHNESEDKVVASPFSTNKKIAISQFLKFINKRREKESN